MKLRARLILAQAPLVIALGLTVIVAVQVSGALGRHSQRILQQNYRSVLATQRMKEALERLDSASMFIALGERDRAEALKRENQAVFEAELRVAEQNITERGEPEAVRAIREHWEQYQRQWEQMGGLSPGAQKEFYFATLNPSFVATKDAADDLLSMNQDAMVRKSDEAKRFATHVGAWLVLGGIGAMVSGFAGSVHLTTRALRPIGILTQTVRRIGSGDLAARAQVRGTDEIAELAKDFNSMADHLERYRKSSLGELIETQHGVQATLDSLPDPIMVLGAGSMRQVNRTAETLLGVRLEDGAAALSALDPRLREQVVQLRDHVLSGRGAWQPRGLSDALRVPTREGDRYLLPRAMPVYSEEGAVAGAAVVLQDVTWLRRFDELTRDLVATVAHEFRTPLTSLRMAIHLLVEEVAGPLTPKQSDLLFAAREDTERLQSVVDELLDLSRVEAGRAALERKTSPVEALVNSAVDAVTGIAKQRQIELRTELDPEPGTMDVDPERFNVALVNLLTNAIRHTPEHGQVSLGAHRDARSVTVEVADQGAGIPEEFRESIFEKYFQVPGAPSGSSGLGLYIAREIVQAHGGEIGVRPGERIGTVFWIRLPA